MIGHYLVAALGLGVLTVTWFLIGRLARQWGPPALGCCAGEAGGGCRPATTCRGAGGCNAGVACRGAGAGPPVIDDDTDQPHGDHHANR